MRDSSSERYGVLGPTPPTPVPGGSRGRQSLLSEFGSCREREERGKRQMDRDRDRNSVSGLDSCPLDMPDIWILPRRNVQGVQILIPTNQNGPN